VPFGDVDALRSAMIELAENPDQARALGEAARRRIERVFSWREAGRRTADVLEEVVRAHRRP
jgi:glycosyltransferase involved in cell wall biosynthesis